MTCCGHIGEKKYVVILLARWYDEMMMWQHYAPVSLLLLRPTAPSFQSAGCHLTSAELWKLQVSIALTY